MRSSRFPTRTLLALLLVPLLALTACGQVTQPPVMPTETPVSLPPTPTPVPPKTLVVCLADEPEDLYIYGDTSRAKWSVLEAVYDGPVDTLDYEASPVILTSLPTVENGGVVLRSTAVSAGDPVANVYGDIVALNKGVRVFPAGCTSPDCAVEWDGSGELTLIQMVVKFTLLEGITWSDGEPLTAQDSIFSFNVSNDPATQVTKTNIDRTFSYTALDERNVEWVGQPGYLTLNPAAFFWSPLPEHMLSALTPQQLTEDPLSTRQPLGWGPYVVDEWVGGDHIRLVKNQNYFRVAEGLPYFDVLVYRFIPATPEADLSMMLTGECDIMDTTAGLESQIVRVRELEAQGEIKSYFGMGPEWEGLHFGIKPASYDDVYNPYEDRQDFFGDVRMRQAIAHCVDREYIQTYITLNQSDIPVTYLPPNHPFAATGTRIYSHDPLLGAQLLDEAGWQDADGNPSTPRVATEIDNIFYNSELALNYYVTESELHASTTTAVVESLGECGIKVTPTYLPVTDMYAVGPEGQVFGRNFDLAELAWSTGRQPPCFLFSSSEIPGEKNKWLGARYGGVNFSGYANDEYDAACELALTAGLERELLEDQAERMQQILMEELPALPLFFHVKAMVSRPDLCGLDLDVSARSPLRGIEALTLGEVCPGE